MAVAGFVAAGSRLLPFSRAASTRRVWQAASAARLQLHTTGAVMHVKPEDFEKAKDQLQLLKNDPGNEVKLKLYALFKQATQGPCNVPKPGMLDFVNKAKWDAWKSLGTISQDEAKETYVNLVSSLVSTESTSKERSTSADSKHDYETLEVKHEDNLTKIILDRPDKKNAISTKMYNELIHSLEAAAKDDSAVTVLTGKGDYYCSGNDLNNFAQASVDNKEKMARDGAVLLEKFVNCFIDFPKPLIAVVNGPAVGVSVTLLGMFDIVYATDRATFHTPFSQLGQSPEGCSSYTFPKIMGYSKANEMLLFNKKLTAKEACDQGLVTEVFPDSTFQNQVWTRVNAYAQLPRQSLALSKQLIRGVEKEKLHSVNSQECERLIERWLSDECMNAILSFFQNKSRL